MAKQLRLVSPGDPAENFSLKDQNDETFDLFEHTANRVLLSFHPLAWTPFCAAQMKSLEDNRDILQSLNTIAVGISVDSIPCKKAWAEQLGITHTPLLCDFFPQGRRKLLRKALEKLRKLESLAMTAAEARLDSPELETRMQMLLSRPKNTGDSSGSLQAPSA